MARRKTAPPPILGPPGRPGKGTTYVGKPAGAPSAGPKGYAGPRITPPSRVSAPAAPSRVNAPTARVPTRAPAQRAPASRTFNRRLVGARNAYLTATAARVLHPAVLGGMEGGGLAGSRNLSRLENWLNVNDPRYLYLQGQQYRRQRGLSTAPPAERRLLGQRRATRTVRRIGVPAMEGFLRGRNPPKVRVRELPPGIAGMVTSEQRNRIFLSPPTARQLGGRAGAARRQARQVVLHEFGHTQQPPPGTSYPERERALREGGAEALAELLINRRYGRGAAAPPPTPFYRRATRKVRRRGRRFIERGQFR